MCICLNVSWHLSSKIYWVMNINLLCIFCVQWLVWVSGLNGIFLKGQATASKQIGIFQLCQLNTQSLSRLWKRKLALEKTDPHSVRQPARSLRQKHHFTNAWPPPTSLCSSFLNHWQSFFEPYNVRYQELMRIWANRRFERLLVKAQ